MNNCMCGGVTSGSLYVLLGGLVVCLVFVLFFDLTFVLSKVKVRSYRFFRNFVVVSYFL